MSLRILELAFTVLYGAAACGHRASADACGRGSPRRLGLPVQSSGAFVPLLLLDWVGAAFQPDLYVTVGRPSQHARRAHRASSWPLSATVATPNSRALFSRVAWYRRNPRSPSFAARVTEAKQAGFAVDRGTMFQGITSISASMVAGMGAVTDPDHAGRSHDLECRSAGAAVPQADAIGGCVPIREYVPRLLRP